HQRQPVRAVRVPGPDPRAGGGLDHAPFDRRVRRPLVAVLPRLAALGRGDPPALGQGGGDRARRAGTDQDAAPVWWMTPPAAKGPGRPPRSRLARWSPSATARWRSTSRPGPGDGSRRSAATASNSWSATASTG